MMYYLFQARDVHNNKIVKTKLTLSIKGYTLSLGI